MDGVRALAPEDLDALSRAAWWLGRVDACLDAGDRAFHGFVQAGRLPEAAMTALDLAVSLYLRGDAAHGSGWIGRAQRVLDDLPECAVHGYFRYVTEVEAGLGGDDPEGVVQAARAVWRIGRRCDDATLMGVAAVGEGRALLKLADVTRGLRLLDEAMLAVRGGDLAPEWAGNVYCHLLAACHELMAIDRAGEWIAATSQWLSEQSAAVLFTGICRVHRAQILSVTGQWDRAEDELGHVLADLADLHVDSVAEAHYQRGELRRLRGDLDGAAHAFERARELGHDPQPGAALLALTRGRSDVAQAAVQAALLAVPHDRLARARLCAAQVEIALAAGDLATAGRACGELEDAAARYRTAGLEAAALHWRGALALAEGRPEEALPALRAACRRWHDAAAAYDAARSCLLLHQAYARMGDQATAAGELAVARDAFERLGAVVDARAAAAMADAPRLPGGLTEREAEVLGLVARGATNREVAAALVLSEKTIARHLSNIFTKLGVATRTEAAAFAFAHGLLHQERG